MTTSLGRVELDFEMAYCRIIPGSDGDNIIGFKLEKHTSEAGSAVFTPMSRNRNNYVLRSPFFDEGL
jgi:hypothetical protein